MGRKRRIPDAERAAAERDVRAQALATSGDTILPLDKPVVGNDAWITRLLVRRLADTANPHRLIAQMFEQSSWMQHVGSRSELHGCMASSGDHWLKKQRHEEAAEKHAAHDYGAFGRYGASIKWGKS